MRNKKFLTQIKLIRFDFSKYRRLNVPNILDKARKEAIGANKIKFWAFSHAHLEIAPIKEERILTSDSECKSFYIANVEIADKIVRKYHHDGVVDKELLQKYIESIEPLSFEVASKFYTYIGESDLEVYVDVAPYYPEVMEIVEHK